MKRWQAMWLVAMREVSERTRSRTFKIGTAVSVLALCAAIVAPAAFSDDSVPSYDIAVVQPAEADLENAIEQTESALAIDIVIDKVASIEIAEAQLRDGDVDLVVVPGRELVTKTAPEESGTLARLVGSVSDISRLFEGLAQQGLTAEQAASALYSEPLPVRELESKEQRDDSNAAAAAGSMILLFVFLTLYGAWILNGVVEEKTSRVVEVLLSTVRADELLIGKVIGIGIVGSVQGIVLAAATFAARSAVGGDAVDLTLEIVAYTLLWFVLGFGIYAWAYACAGALVSRAQDAQNLVFPLQLPLLASYMVGLISTTAGPNSALTVMSMIPFTAPMTMLARMAADDAPLWQVLISIGSSALTAYLVMKLAITIFSGGILRSGQRVKLRDAWRGSS